MPEPRETHTAIDARRDAQRGGGDAAEHERFWARVDGGDVTECWTWTGGFKGSGYGSFYAGGRNVVAHRWAYEHLRAPIPEGLQIDHLCRNRACVNPWHMEPVTNLVNARRGHAGWHMREKATLITHCPHGHEYTPENAVDRGPRKGRHCRTCSVEFKRELRRRRRLEGEMGESRQRRRIRRAVESRGFAVESLTWEPPYYAGEKSGLGGGWFLTVDRPHTPHVHPGNEVGGLSVEELLADIDWSLTPPEPCSCSEGRPGRHPLVSILGDPERPLHAPPCRWYIAYRLRWWRRAPSDPATDTGGEGL